MIKFQGLMGQTFGGFVTIRGTAKFSDIVQNSEAKEYQRETITTHLTDISNFYEERENLFFPEVILSLELKYDFSIHTDDTIVNPIPDILRGAGFKSNIENVEVKVLAKRHPNDTLRVANILLEESDIKLLGRIDGNHRLTAENNTNIYDEEIPFCIVLFDSSIIQKREKMLFFNINSKGIPLTTEESLKSIFNDEENFDDGMLKTNTSFGWEYYFAKQLNEEEINRYFPNLNTLFDGRFYTTFLKLFQLLLENNVIDKVDDEITKIRDALTIINTSIYNETSLKDSHNTSVFSSFLYYQLKAPELINFLKSWVLKNEIYNVDELEPNSVIKIMDNIASHKVKKVFVAMPYYNHPKVTEYNKLFREALKLVEDSLDLPFTLELFDIMRHRGETVRIDEQLLNQIRQSDIFIADLTGANVNVLYETAFAEALDIPSLLIKEDSDKAELPFDMDKRLWKPFTEASYYSSIIGIVKHNLPKILSYD